MRDIVEEACLQFDAYRQYMYFAISSKFNQSVIEQHYSNTIDSFDQHLNECEEIDEVFFTLAKRGEGITKRSVEKGGK